MTHYLFSFEDGAMTFPDEDLPDVARASMGWSGLLRSAKSPMPWSARRRRA